ncbi:hypothetical protein Nepgr_025808 [Nepenthes gracilis]|uniref:Uncharacterized protein n=1 Tax=Nepenthes gracilis TaxID=150966 RepID=A0AAD3T6P6_NEPGR|nr:hypothetical protein Nepgr_025808 [Nepenthes gracilis]
MSSIKTAESICVKRNVRLRILPKSLDVMTTRMCPISNKSRVRFHRRWNAPSHTRTKTLSTWGGPVEGRAAKERSWMEWEKSKHIQRPPLGAPSPRLKRVEIGTRAATMCEGAESKILQFSPNKYRQRLEPKTINCENNNIPGSDTVFRSTDFVSGWLRDCKC